MKKAAVAFLVSIACTAAMPATQVLTLSMPSMNCAICPLLVKRSLTKVDGVVDVDGDVGRREATVVFDDDEASPAEVLKTLQEAGYPSTIVHSYTLPEKQH